MRIKSIWAGGIYALAATAVTWPLIRRLNEALPLGSETVPTVPLFNLWTLSWNVNRLRHGYRGYWDAPIFYPASGTFAFSDPQPLTGLLAAVFWPFGSAAAYNLVLLLFLTLNGWAAFRLLRHRGLAAGPALLGGLLVQMLPFLAHERGVLQLQPIFGVLWAVDGLWLLAERPRPRYAVQAGLGLAVTFLTSEYYALFLIILLAAAVPFLPPFWRKRRFWPAVWPGILLAILLTAPIAWQQTRRVQAMGFSRTVRTITHNSATLNEYGRISSTLQFHHWLPWQFEGSQALFPGAGLLVLALLGSYTGWQTRRRWTLYLLAGAAAAFFLSLGFNLKIGDWQPYAWLRDFAPGFDNLRSPFRWGYFGQIYLALLAASFLDRLWGYGRRGRWLAAGAAALVVLELLPAPARLAAVPPPLETQNLTPPLIFLPFPESKSVRAYAATAAWMVAASDNPVPMVNGYSGYFPQMNGQLRDLLADFPTFAGLEALRSLGVRTIVIDQASLTPEQISRLAAETANGRLRPRPPLRNFLVYELPGAQFNPAANYTGQWVLSAAVEGDDLTLWAYAAVPDAQWYVVDPVLSPLDWQVIVTEANGRRREYAVSPPGTVLLYRGSGRRLPLSLPLPEAAGAYTVTLRHRETGELLGKVQLQKESEAK